MVGSDAARRGDEQILVIDDELACLQLTRAMLSRYGYSVVTAESGREALELLAKQPDLTLHMAIIDIVLNDMTGLELAKEIRSVRPALPILFISSYSQNPALRPESLRHIPFLPKPFTSITLTETIRQMLQLRTASGC
jgi:CheY-like chemotaxis protein